MSDLSDFIVVEDVIEDLVRIQNFDAHSLVQLEKLGREFSFEEAVKPADRLISLFSKLPKDALFEFPKSELELIQKLSKSVYNTFEQILNFNAKAPDAEATHSSLINTLLNSYQANFSKLFPLISFAVARTVDFNRLSEDGRAAVQSVRDQSKKALDDITATSKKADAVLLEVRDAAARQGVTQQARYFKEEAEFHSERAEQWKIGLFVMSGLVLICGASTLFFRYIPFLTANTPTEAIQLVASKVLIFFILFYVLFVFSRNYSAHKHNSIVNKHRQNALMTFTTLAEAGSTVEARDVVLQHAAAAIYAPNDTGYMKNEERGYSSQLPISIGPKLPLPGPDAS
tara:strand:- start:73 stop:1101 length:1029 start_codon:yes stop_codon:yes gene_type:complete